MFERFLAQTTFVALEHEDPGSLGQEDSQINKEGGQSKIGKENYDFERKGGKLKDEEYDTNNDRGMLVVLKLISVPMQ